MKDYKAIYKSIQERKAFEKLKVHQFNLDKFISDWNKNPEHRSKLGQLQIAMEEERDILLRNLELTMKR